MLIYVRLLNEGTEVLRPGETVEVRAGVFKILAPDGYESSDEEWEFPPGSEVRVESRTSHEKTYLMAIRA